MLISKGENFIYGYFMPNSNFKSVFENLAHTLYIWKNHKPISMKKSILFLSILFVFNACQNPAPSSSVSYEGEQIEALKGLIAAFTAGDFDAYRAFFTDDAKITHNVWYQQEDASISIDEMVKVHMANRENVFASISVNDGIYEIITQENGNQFGHVWIEFTVKGYGSDEAVKIPVNLSFHMKGTQVDSEWAFYDTSNFPEPKTIK